MNFQKSIIAPETVAAKFASAANLSDQIFAELLDKQPRIRELIWFLQWASMQPGSLEKYGPDLVDEFLPMFGPAMLHQENPQLNIDQRFALFDLLPISTQSHLIDPDAWPPSENGLCDNYDHEDSSQVSPTIHALRANYWRRGIKLKRTVREDALLRPMLLKIEPKEFLRVFIEGAKRNIAARLREIITGPAAWITSPTWWCEDIIAVLFEAMDLHASRALQQLAHTEVVNIVFETLDYAWFEKVLVKIEGNSRFGKTESIKAWCSAYPGRARLISTPPSNIDKDMHKAIADGIGLHYDFNTPGAKLKEAVEFCIHHSGLLFLIDEAHYILPQRITRNTLPTRLNWIRSNIIDRKLPVAIVVTPQVFTHAADKFQTATGYNFEQFLGRIAYTATLPDSLGEEDLFAIARHHGPELDERSLKEVVGQALLKQSYIKAVENIISLARWNAGRAGRSSITLEDVQTAAAGRIHVQAAVTAAVVGSVASARARTSTAFPARSRATVSPPPAKALEAPARSITPKTQTAEHV